ncbi:MAG TPA: 50S ribosomal protein L11 methyltransferase [Polyangia bacterium]|nr:50S ribosomal protein L11 methyltransferase [Polyangia bacterium]
MSDWVEVQIEAAAEAAELIAAAVELEAGGVEIRDAETVFPTARDRTTVVLMVPPAAVEAMMDDVHEALDLARAGGTPVDPVTIRLREAHEDEWRDVWKQFFRATRVGRRFVVRPSWDPGPAPPGEHVVDLDPGRAFGTGAHPSTRLVIRFVEELRDRRPALASFLDLGCGSGILSIVAARLWPEARGLAVDLDPEATECSGENFERNGITTVVRRTGGLEVVSEAHDLVMANIQADVLQQLAGALPDRLAPGGALVLSGLLTSDVEAVTRAFEAAGLRVEQRYDEGEWAALLVGRGR